MKRYLLGAVKALDDNSDPNGSFEVILSAPTLDRDGEIVDSKIFEPLPDHITFDIDHGMSVATTVGSGVPRYDEAGRLVVSGTYSSIPRAQEVRTLVREGHIRTTSVAFMDAQRVKGEDGKTHVVSAELLNGAFVPIPSNRESVVLSAKDFATKVGSRNSAKDAERLQQIHDLATENGAECGAEKSARTIPAVRKFAGGLSANGLREGLTSTLRNTYGAERVWVWVRDFDTDWVVFEVEDAEGLSLYRQGYTASTAGVELTDSPEPVTIQLTYVPAPQAAPQDTDPTKSAAPVTPAAEAGKSPASGISFGEYVRTRIEATAP